MGSTRISHESFCGQGTASQAAEKIGKEDLPPAKAGSEKENKQLIGTTEVVP